jgi:hypothetical protein
MISHMISHMTKHLTKSSSGSSFPPKLEDQPGGELKGRKFVPGVICDITIGSQG